MDLLSFEAKENNYVKNFHLSIQETNTNRVDNILVWLLTYAQQRALLMSISHWQSVHHKDIHIL